MKLVIAVVQKDVPGKPHKVKREITKMFGGNGTEFVEFTCVLLRCPYCGHKFRSPQSLVAYKYMDERAIDCNADYNLTTPPPA